MNRALRAATVGVLLFSPLALSACGAGQVNQTSTQVRDKVGPMAEVGDLVLRGVHLAYPTDGSYQPGDDAELQMAIINTGTEDDTLVGIRGTGFSEVRVTGSPSGTVSASQTGAATTTSSTTTSSAATSSGAQPIDIAVPAGRGVYLGQNAQTVTLVALGQELTPAQTMDLTFVFERAGEVTMAVPVAVPSSNVPQTSSYDFHGEGSGGEGSGGETTGAAETSGNG